MTENTRTPVKVPTKDRIIDAAATLLAEGGRGAVSTRAICDAAHIQPPTIYRLFGNKDGLLAEVAKRGFLAHQASWDNTVPTSDPIADLRAGWDQHIAFGLANPYLFSLMYGQAQPNGASVAAVTANDVLNALIHRIAEAGLLRVSETFAAFTMNVAGCGTVLSLLALPEPERDASLADAIRDSFIAQVTNQQPVHEESGLIGAAVTLNSLLDSSDALKIEERTLMHHWLSRITC